MKHETLSFSIPNLATLTEVAPEVYLMPDSCYVSNSITYQLTLPANVELSIDATIYHNQDDSDYISVTVIPGPFVGFYNMPLVYSKVRLTVTRTGAMGSAPVVKGRGYFERR